MNEHDQPLRIIELGGSDIAELRKAWRIQRLVVELTDNGAVARELGYDELGRIVHRWPGGETIASRGIFDLTMFDASVQAETDPEQYERLWQSAIEEEAFFAINDPHGDRFGTEIPWWGCVGALIVVAAGAYALLF